MALTQIRQFVDFLARYPVRTFTVDGEASPKTQVQGVVLVDPSGDPVDSSTVTIAGGVPELAIINAIDSVAFDLNAAAFSTASSVSNDYILNSIKLNFSTTESKTITVTGPDGTIIYEDTNTNQSVSLGDINIAFNGGENFTVAVTIFGSAGTMDCVAVVTEGSATLGGDPVLGTGTNSVGTIGIDDHGNYISTTAFNSRAAATLAAAATFQGVGEEVLAYGRVGVAISSDNATDGTLTMEVSHDNVIWGGPSRTWADTSIAAPHMWNIVEKYFRIKYVNGTTEATNLSIQVQYSNNSDIILGHQLNEILPPETEAVVVRPANDFDLDAARKHITGQRSFFFFGHNNALTNGTFEDVWAGGGDIQWQTVAAKIKVASSHAADTSAGLGCQSVEVHGLSATGVDQDEVIALNGTTAVESSLTYIRVNLVHNEEVGTYGGSHQGDIEVRVTNATFGSGALLAKMEGIEGAADSGVQYGYGEAQSGFTSIPLGKVCYITRLEVIPKANKPINVVLYERDGLLTIADPFQPRRILWSAEELEIPVEKEFKSHIKIKALADLFFRAEGTGAGAGIDVALDYYLVDADSSGA